MPVLLHARLHALSSERLVLMSRARAERARLRAALAPAEEIAGKAARLRESLRRAGPAPLALGAAAVALVLLKPRAFGKWLARGLAAWRLYQEARRRFPGALARAGSQR